MTVYNPSSKILPPEGKEVEVFHYLQGLHPAYLDNGSWICTDSPKEMLMQLPTEGTFWRELQEAAKEEPFTLFKVTDPSQITLRDHFACRALQGMAASDHWSLKFTPHYLDSMAKVAYQAADAMLKARG